MAKRVYSPTGITPDKPTTKRGGGAPSARKRLSYQSQPVENWTEVEDQALTQFILLSCVGGSWPSTKNMKLWEGHPSFCLTIAKLSEQVHFYAVSYAL